MATEIETGGGLQDLQIQGIATIGAIIARLLSRQSYRLRLRINDIEDTHDRTFRNEQRYGRANSQGLPNPLSYPPGGRRPCESSRAKLSVPVTSGVSCVVSSDNQRYRGRAGKSMHTARGAWRTFGSTQQAGSYEARNLRLAHRRQLAGCPAARQACLAVRALARTSRHRVRHCRVSDVDFSDCVCAVVGSGPRGDWTQ